MRISAPGSATRASEASAAAPLRQALAPLLLCLLALVAGCLTVDATLDADGSATIDMTYPLQAGTKPDVEKARLKSEFVTLESFEELKQNRVRVEVKVSDVSKLSTAAAFKDVAVTRTKEGTDEVLKIAITKPRPVTVKQGDQPGPVFAITLPGKVVKANRDAKVDGNKVTWSFPFATYAAEKKTELEVTYAAATGDAAGAASDPAGDAAEKGTPDAPPGAAPAAK
jgi:hypothetical protein